MLQSPWRALVLRLHGVVGRLRHARQPPSSDDAARAREDADRRVAKILETMSDGFVVLDRQWRYRAINRRAGQLLGRDAASLLGKHIWTEFPDGVGQPFHRAYERAMNEGVTVQLEAYYPPFDAWFENRIHPGPDGISIFFTDITERRRAELAVQQTRAALEASEARYRILFEHNPSPMLVYERPGMSLLAVNEAFCRQYGYTREQAIGLDLGELYPPPDRAGIVALASSLEGLAHIGEAQHRRRDGSSLVVEVRSHDIDFQGRTARIAVLNDISERRRVEAERHAAAQRFERLFVAAPEAISLSELASGRFLQVNDAFCEMFGYRREEVIGRTSLELKLWTVPDGRRGIVEQLRRGEAVHGFEGMARHHSGTEIEVLFSAEKVTLDDQDCLLLMFRDITARKKAEQALATSQQQMAELSRRLLDQERATTRALAQTLHDHVGQTLAGARLYSGLALGSPKLDPDAARLVGQASGLVGEAIAEIRRLLAELRPPLLETFGLVLSLENEVATSAAADLGIALRLEAEPALKALRWPDAVEYAALMVAREAMVNALHHARCRSVRVSLQGDAGGLRLTVGDDGQGIADADLQGRPGHLGLVGMRERASAVGARFEVVRNGSGGTTISFDWRAATPKAAGA